MDTNNEKKRKLTEKFLMHFNDEKERELMKKFLISFIQCKKLSNNLNKLKNINYKMLVFYDFYNFYIQIMKHFDSKILSISNINKKNEQISNINIKKKIITRKKNIVDKILDNLDNKNQILPSIVKNKNTNENKLKNLANKYNVESESLQEEFDRENFFKNVDIIKLRELYEKKFRKETMTQTEQNLLKIVNEILNKNAKKLSNIQALKLKKNLVGLNNTETTKLQQLELKQLINNSKKIKSNSSLFPSPNLHNA